MQHAHVPTSPPVNLLGVLIVMLATLVPVVWHTEPENGGLGKLGWTLLGLAVSLGVVIGGELLRYRQPGQSLQRVASGAFAICYAGLLLSFLVQLRIWSPDRLGLLAVIATILVVKLADSGAYFVGKSLGRRKLAPRLSPGKTVEGAVGAVGSALLGAWLVHSLLLPWFCPAVTRGALGWYLLFGVSMALAGMLGDLAESLLKRDAQCKDSSSWMPGLGGILDVLDSLLGAAPISFAWWAGGWLAAAGS
jgi:phosphatidate cytidylyltransferase